MFAILPLTQFKVETPERRLAQFLNAWASCDWERMTGNCVALFRSNPGYSVQRLKRYFGQRFPPEQDGGISIIGADQGASINLVSAEILFSKSKGPYAKVVAQMEFVRRGDGKKRFGEVFTFELIREVKATGAVDPIGTWYVVPKFEVYSEQCFDVDNIFGSTTAIEEIPSQATEIHVEQQHVENLIEIISESQQEELFPPPQKLLQQELPLG